VKSLTLNCLVHLQERLENILQRPSVDVCVDFFDRLRRIPLVSARALECKHVCGQPHALHPFFIAHAHEHRVVDVKCVTAGYSTDTADFPCIGVREANTCMVAYGTEHVHYVLKPDALEKPDDLIELT
jgi:hypothetical protein